MIILAALVIDFSVSFRINQEKTQVIRSAEPYSGSTSICDMAKKSFLHMPLQLTIKQKGEWVGFPQGAVIKKKRAEI